MVEEESLLCWVSAIFFSVGLQLISGVVGRRFRSVSHRDKRGITGKDIFRFYGFVDEVGSSVGCLLLSGALCIFSSRNEKEFGLD